MAAKRGLGKGLDSLIPQSVTPVAKTEVKTVKEQASGEPLEIEISLIDPNSTQPRSVFSEDELNELAESIEMHGIIQPILVVKKGKRYQIIAGERRWRAAKIAGLKKVPVIIKEYDEQKIMEISLIENLQREDLNPIETARAYQKLIDEYHLTQDELAERISKARTSITNSMRLLKLDSRVQQMVEEGKISGGHARALLTVENKDTQYELAQKIFDEKLSVRDVERLVKRLGEEPKNPEPSAVKSAVYRNLEEDLKTIIGSKVTIRNKANGKGRIEIDYYSSDELERITQLLGSIRGREE